MRGPPKNAHSRRAVPAQCVGRGSLTRACHWKQKAFAGTCGWRLLEQSATQLYSYFVFLWRVPIILTTNNWDCSGFSEADKNWLETNCVAVHIAHRVWKSAPTAPASAATSKRVWRSLQKQGDAEGRDWAAPMDED